jgi:hypothetical protein
MRTLLSPLLSGCLASVVAACSSSSSPTTEPDAGRDSGVKNEAGVDPVKAFVVHNSYASFAYEMCTGGGNPDAPYGTVDGGCSGESLGIVLTSNPKLTCSAASSSANYLDVPDTSNLILTFGSEGALATGTYTLGSIKAITAHANFGNNDGQCNVTDALVGEGTVTLTALTTSSASGTYDITFKNGDALKGSFDVKECAGATNPAILSEAVDAGACNPL